MKLPTTIRVGYKDYAVELWPAAIANAERALGQCDPLAAKIYVCEGLFDIETAKVLMHEVFHALWDVGCLHAAADHDEELAVSVLSNGFMQVWRDNPALRECLMLAV